MEYGYIFLVLISCFPLINTQKFEEESRYMPVRLMDLKTHEWKPAMLDRFEQVLDAELKYSDEKKGVACKSIDFEQEAGYPKQDARFLDLSIRGLCTDNYGKVHNIDKGLMTVAIERHIDEVNAAIGATVYRVGNVQLFKRGRNKLNFIVIPISVGFTVVLLVLTFVLRRVRAAQKRRHILAELEKKKAADGKKGATVANVDPNATERQRLLQLDPTVVGNASDTLGSPKDFTTEQYSGQPRGNPSGSGFQREYRDGSPSKNNRDNNSPLRNQRMNAPYESDSRFSANQYDSDRSNMIPMNEQQPRVIVRTVRVEPNHPSYYQQQYDEPSSSSFVPIPVQVEHSGPHQRYVQPPYHSDPYYRHANS